MFPHAVRTHADGFSFVALRESALGSWTPTVERLWIDGLAGTPVTAIADAALVTAEGYDNVLVAISATGSTVPNGTTHGGLGGRQRAGL